MRLVSIVGDTHANIFSITLDSIIGKNILPNHLTFIDDTSLVVTRKIYGLESNTVNRLLPGDLVKEIDGIKLKNLIDYYLPITAASNFERKLYLMTTPKFGWLCRSNKNYLTIKIKRDKSFLKIKVKLIPYNPIYTAESNNHIKFEIFKDSIGYISASNLDNNDIDTVYTCLKNTKYLIIDLRQYPGTFMPYLYARWLKQKPSDFAETTTFSGINPGYFLFNTPLRNGGNVWDSKKEPFKPYTGKIIILVNSSTISQGEFTAMAFRSIPNSIIIGSKTAGADGDVASVPLPGGISTQISGLGIYYPNGAETQRVGVKIDSVVYQTVKGIREGKDELLEKAVRIIEKD